ncbi:MAG: hypothetical protein HY567_01365 [Candidatus Kerfeldbacteria bacterium]|nr:hypothetical protein [Candidatus Kerfeldbacteria bacterium]
MNRIRGAPFILLSVFVMAIVTIATMPTLTQANHPSSTATNVAYLANLPNAVPTSEVVAPDSKVCEIIFSFDVPTTYLNAMIAICGGAPSISTNELADLIWSRTTDQNATWRMNAGGMSPGNISTGADSDAKIISG